MRLMEIHKTPSQTFDMHKWIKQNVYREKRKRKYEESFTQAMRFPNQLNEIAAVWTLFYEYITFELSKLID